MPEEVAIALVVLLAIGWLIYKLVEGIAAVAQTAKKELTSTIGTAQNRRFQQEIAETGLDFYGSVGSSVTGTVIPEPGTLFLLGTGLIGSALVLMRKRVAKHKHEAKKH